MARGASARLFAALDPPVEVAHELLRWAREAGRESSADPRILAADSLHVTLMFLGERPFEEIEELSDALAAAAARGRACELHTGAPLWLPPRRPRALAVELHDPEGDLAELQRDLSRALCGVTGLQAPRRFRAHLTLARSRPGGLAGGALPSTPSLRFVTEEVVLYRSRLEPHGARYERIAAAPLMG